MAFRIAWRKDLVGQMGEGIAILPEGIGDE